MRRTVVLATTYTTRLGGSRHLRVTVISMEQARQARRWLESQFLTKYASTEAILPDGIGRIAFGQVGADQGSVCALPKRVAGDCRQTGHYCLLVMPCPRPHLAQALEKMKADLALPLTFEHDPVVVPAGKELTN